MEEIIKDKEILKILLKDNNSNKNILWCTSNYEDQGDEYKFNQEIKIKSILNKKGLLVKSRIYKTKEEVENRIRIRGEVFTPAWVCNYQNNLIDDVWFNAKNTFNFSIDNQWKSNDKKIDFSSSKKTWKDYINDKRIEITCGEAPYLVSRYDAYNGDEIKIKDRIGLLDRKLRVVNENSNTQEEWYDWVIKSYKNIYGYEWQGDNLIIARINLLVTFIEYYQDKFNERPHQNQIKEIAKIISYNIWQMDGLKGVIPESCEKKEKSQLNFFDEIELEECLGCLEEDKLNLNHNGIYCYIKDWDKNKKKSYVDIIKGGKSE